MDQWYEVLNASEISSPCLLLYPARVRENIRRMIAMIGDVNRLRPHMKTHKLAEVIGMQMEQGITKFKCATIAEAEMVARCGAAEVLLAYQPVGPNVQRVVQLAMSFPGTSLSVIADDSEAIRALSAAAVGSARGPRAPVGGPPTGTETETEAAVEGSDSTRFRAFEAPRRAAAPDTPAACAPRVIEVLLDLDIGQHRTGVAPGPQAVELYRLVASLPGLKSGGLHAYDGHIHDSDVATRTRNCHTAFAPVADLRQQLEKAGFCVPRIVAGGTPTFPLHARRAQVECSPGTCVFWDAGYGTNLPDLDFLPAALVLTRVVSKPTANRLCLDLGHKAIASEMPHPRVQFLNLAGAKAVAHNEEHLVVETERAGEFAVGDCLYGIPWHICPTVAFHSEAVVVEDGTATQRWKVVARERRLTI